MRTVAIVILTMILSAVLAGCGSARRGVPMQPPLEIQDPDLKGGQQVFMRFCNGCHPRGEAGLGLAINNKPLPGWLIRFQVRNGLGVMPGFSDDVISDERLSELVAYLKRLRRHDG